MQGSDTIADLWLGLQLKSRYICVDCIDFPIKSKAIHLIPSFSELELSFLSQDLQIYLMVHKHTLKST